MTGASIVAHGQGNNIIKLWLTTTDKAVVDQFRGFLSSTLNADDYASERVTFVPHKLVIKGSSQRKAPMHEFVSMGPTHGRNFALPERYIAPPAAPAPDTVAAQPSKRSQRRKKGEAKSTDMQPPSPDQTPPGKPSASTLEPWQTLCTNGARHQPSTSSQPPIPDPFQAVPADLDLGMRGLTVSPEIVAWQGQGFAEPAAEPLPDVECMLHLLQPSLSPHKFAHPPVSRLTKVYQHPACP